MTTDERLARLEDAIVALTAYIMTELGAGNPFVNRGSQESVGQLRHISGEILLERSG